MSVISLTEFYNRAVARILSQEDPTEHDRVKLSFERQRSRQASNVEINGLRGSNVNTWLGYARTDYENWARERREGIRQAALAEATDSMVAQFRRVYGHHAEEEAYISWRRCVPHWDGRARNSYGKYLNDRLFGAERRRPKSAGGAAKRPRY